MKTSQLAEQAGVNIQTLRYYERRGLLPEPDRSLGGHRYYPPDTVELIKVIKAAQRLGFTLAEIADLLKIGRHQHHADRGLHHRVAAKLTEIKARIADLTTIRDVLSDVLAAGCDDLTNCTSPNCPLPYAGLSAGRPPL